ncbi:MAG TPA: pilin [Patescibacteria group bacterium]|nr:pilin [Patescibacteria group bacterium]
MKNAKKKFISLFVLFFLLLLPIVNYTMNSASAADSLWDAQVGIEDVGQKAYGETGAPQDIRVTVMEIINVVLQLLAVIFVVLIIISGYQWMTAGGNEEQVKKAKKNLSNATIGLAIILASWSISYFILKSLVAVSENDPMYLKVYN